MSNEKNGGGYASGPIPPYKITRETKSVKIKVRKPEDPNVDIVPILVKNADEITINSPEGEKTEPIVGGETGNGEPEQTIDDGIIGGGAGPIIGGGIVGGESDHITDDDKEQSQEDDEDKNKKKLGIPIIIGVVVRNWCIVIT